MKKLLVTLALAAFVSLTLGGCGGSSQEADPEGEGYQVSAMQIDDGATPWDQMQYMCPVTGDPIKPEHYVDYQGKRIYFSSEEAAKKFKGNEDNYIQNYRQMMRQQMSGGGQGGR